MFRFLESFIDPFRPVETTPPDRLWPYLLDNLKPFRGVLAVVSVMSLSVASIETGLIYYAGRLVDLMAASGPESFSARHGLELAVVVLLILIARPIVIVGSIALLNHGMSVNLLDQVRWRAHRHLLGQSVGFFQNDFAGRIANRVMQTGPAVEDSTYMFFEAIWYAAAYVLGAVLILGQRGRAADPAHRDLAARLPHTALCPDPEDRQGVQAAVGCAFDGDRADRGFLYQHADGEALRPCLA